MNDNDGTFSKLMEIAETAPPTPPSKPPTPVPELTPEAKPTAVPIEVSEDLNTTPYISQNYRFTEDELRWLKRQAFDLTDHFGTKVSQNMILRVALHDLRQACDKNPTLNPLVRSLSRLKK